MNNSLQKTGVKSLLSSETVKAKFAEVLGSKSPAFITSVLTAVSGDVNFDRCEPNSVLSAAMMAATLDLPINKSLGYAYIIPYSGVAQFQIGYKGFIQLAMRSGQVKKLEVTEIFDGQITDRNPLKGNTYDFNNKLSGTVIGYAAYLELINGFEKDVFWPIEKIKEHRSKYSKSGNVWNTNFDEMAKKTVIKNLINKFCPLSIEMQRAIQADQAVINDVNTMDVTYVDNGGETKRYEPVYTATDGGNGITVVEPINNEKTPANGDFMP